MTTVMCALLLFLGASASEDSRGNSCSWYGQHPDQCGCCDNDNFTALACDECAGVCRDTDFGVFDSTGDSCQVYGAVHCTGRWDTESFKSSEMCCVCGGGLGSLSPCEDTDDGLQDSVGDGCQFYGSAHCTGDWDTQSFRAAEMCCICGGGNHNPCRDTDDGVLDSSGDGCRAYAAHHCMGAWDTEAFRASELCCICGGGSSSSGGTGGHGSGGPELCNDTDDGVLDSFGDDCRAYAAHHCTGAWDTEAFKASELCCICGGGSSSSSSGTGGHGSGGPDPCNDTDDGVLDSVGDGCRAYAARHCTGAWDTEAFIASKFCCVCGGGSSSNAVGRSCDVDPSTNLLTLDGQDQVNEFGREGCTAVHGGILLTGNVRDLSPLQNLASIGVSDSGYSLQIHQAEELETLSGLGGSVLATVPGEIWVEKCSQLRSLQGLESVGSAAALTLQDLPQLQGLQGLRGLKGSVGELWVSNCSRLQSLEGLEGISSVGSGGIRLQELPQLQDLQGLRGLTSLSDIWVSTCSRLQSLEGLEGAKSAGSIHLSKLPRLQNLSGLGGLQGAMAGGISLLDLSSLGSLAGLEAVTQLGATRDGWSLELRHLPLLTSLSPLRQLRGRMAGGLLVFDCRLPSLRGLENISSFNSSKGLALHLEVLDITSLNGLAGLRGQLGGAIQIVACHQLRTLEDLQGLTMLGRSAGGFSLLLEELGSLTSLRGLRGLAGTLPGSLSIERAAGLADLEGLQGLTGVSGEGPDLRGGAIRLVGCPSLMSILGLRGLRGHLNGLVRLDAVSLPSLAGLEGLSGVAGTLITQDGPLYAFHIRCWALESLDGLGGLTGTLNGSLVVFSGHLQSLEATAENLMLSVGFLFISTRTPVCDRAAVLKRLAAIELRDERERHVFQVPPGQPPHCRSCLQPCHSFRGRRVTCDVLRGGCRCPLGRAGPDCLETPLLDVALPPEEKQRTLRIHRPPPRVSTARRLDLCLPLWRSNGSASNTTAVRLKELLANDTCPTRTAGYSLLPPFNNVSWSSNDPTQGCLTVHLEVWSSWSCSSPLRLALAYESPSGGRYPDHLINRTLSEVGDPWDHPWPECLQIGTCSEQQEEMALVVHFVEQEDCPWNMDLDYTGCEASLCPGSAGSPPGDALGATVPRLQNVCECHQGQALEGSCVARPGHWALRNGTSAVPCPLSPQGKSTCLGRNRCSPGYEGVMCAACPAGHVQQNGSCSACSSGQGVLCAISVVLFVVAAALLPHLLSCQRLKQCLEYGLYQDGPAPVQWNRLRTKLKITYLKLQELLVWSWGFLLLFPEVRQRLGGFIILEFLAEAFSSLVFPPFLQCGCGVDVFGEFGILMLAPTVFVLVASASACWGAWTGSPGLAAEGRRRGLLSTCRHCASRCCQLWAERSGLQLLFCALHFTFSPISALIIVYAPAPGVGFHCLGEGEEQECFFRRDYRLRLDSSEYAAFSGWWLLCCPWQLCALVLLLLCLCQPRTMTAAPAGVTALFCSEFRPKRAPFEIVNLLRQTLLAGAVLLFPGGSLPQLYWSCLISGAYLVLLHLVEPYRNRGDELWQSLNTAGGVILFLTLIVELALASATWSFLHDPNEGWVKTSLQATATAVLLAIPIAPIINPSLHLALRRLAAWRDRLARGNENKLHPDCEYERLVLEEKLTGREENTESLCGLLLWGMERIEREAARFEAESPLSPLPRGLQELSKAVEYARKFRLEEFMLPGEPDHHNRRWMHVHPGSEVLTRATLEELLRVLSKILFEVVGKHGKRRPQVLIRTQGIEERLSRGQPYYSFMLLRERKTRPTDEPTTGSSATWPSLKQLLEFGINRLGEELETQESLRTSERGGRDVRILERLVHYDLEEVPVPAPPQLAGYLEESQRLRHAIVRAHLDRSMDHLECNELLELLQRPFELACGLLNISLDPAWSLRSVTRSTGPPIPYPQLPPPPAPALPSQAAAAPQPTTLGQPASSSGSSSSTQRPSRRLQPPVPATAEPAPRGHLASVTGHPPSAEAATPAKPATSTKHSL